jgi:ATP-dependent protease ClpP protease subunit|tara:strand:+ start:3825 stop:4508 length:684 start_codon:yes stop_codon:yes gene_type:complete
MNFSDTKEASTVVTSDVLSDIQSYGIDLKNREIYLHGYVTNTEDDPGVDYKMASTFYKNIRILDKISKDPIIIHMHSVGGNWNDGMAIYDAIVMCKSRVTIIVYGQAESMSSIILQAADKRVMMPNSYFMCHFGSTGISGNFLDVQKGAAFEKRITESMLNMYSESCVKGKYFKDHYSNPDQDKTKNYLKRKFKDGDWYLDANESVYYGFADLVLNTRKFSSIDSLK